jgi:insertion element IS1 protein InsB
LTDELNCLASSNGTEGKEISESGGTLMKCPDCGGDHIRKNGHRKEKQNYICVNCGRQFLEQYDSPGYSDEVKRLCLKMYVNGMGVRGISRVTDIKA